MNIQNQIIENKNEQLKKLLFRLIVFVAYPAYIVHSCVTSPLYTVLYSNVDYTYLSLIFFYLNIFIDLFVFFLSYSVIIYGMYRLSLKQIKTTFIFATLSPIFKYALKLMVSPIFDGAFKLNDFISDVFTVGVSGALEIAQFLIIVFVSNQYINKYKNMETVVAKASARLNFEGVKEELEVFPFKKLFNLKNPLQRGAFISGVVVSVLRLANLFISDISKGIFFNDIGGALLFIGGYLLEILIGVIGYFFMIYMFITIAVRDAV